MHRLRHLRGVADEKADIDAFMLAAERHQVPRQPIAGDRLARHHKKRAMLAAAEFAQQQLRRLRLGHDAARRAEKQRPRLGQFDPPPDAVKQLRIVPRLQRRDRGAHRRLAKMQRFRRPRHMLALRDGDENPELIESHGESLR
jgi:hypothetical protein